MNRKASMTKSDFIMTLCGSLIGAKGNRLTLSNVKELFPKARSTYFNNIKKLLEFTMPSGDFLFIKYTESEVEYLGLNKSFTKSYIPEGVDNIYHLEALIKIGRLLDNTLMKGALKDIKDTYQINGKGRELNEKFHLLTRVESNCDQGIYKDLITALIKNLVINFKYNEKSYSDYKPLSICQHRDALYLIAFMGPYKLENIKTFKLTRFKEVTITDLVFNYPAKWNVEKYFEKSSGLITGSTSKAVLRVFKESRLHIKEKSFFNKVLKESTETYDEYDLTYSNTDEFLGQLFTYAQDILILGPPELKEKFIEKAKQALILNDEDLAA
jgi:predicted DNA-binding transcriptional regulator YafY